MPSFSRDASALYYVRRESTRGATTLWRADVASGRSDPLLPGVEIGDYDVSPDGREIVFSRRAAGEAKGIWIALTDGASPPRLVASGGENTPHFGPRGEIVFRYAEKNFNYVGRMNRDGTGRSKIAAFPISTFQAFSPDRAWVVAIVASADSQRSGASALVSTRDGTRHPLCAPSVPQRGRPTENIST